MCSDIEDLLIPVPSSLLLNLVDNRQAVDAFLRALPASFAATRDVDTCTGSALHFAAKLLQDTGGLLSLFQASMPSLGPAKLKPREVPAMLGTDSEKDLLKPASPFYTELAHQLVAQQISVHCFLGAASADVASLAPLCVQSGGQLFYYPAFHQQSRWAAVLASDVHRVLARETGFESMYRVRVPSGVRVRGFAGAFCLSNTDLMVSPVCHSDLTVSVEFELDSVLQAPSFPIQGALLFTNARGERRIRVHTAVLPVSNVLNHMFERLRQDVIADLVLQRCSFFLFLSLTRSDRGHSGGGSGDRAAESPPAVPGDSEANEGAGPRRAERADPRADRAAPSLPREY